MLVGDSEVERSTEVERYRDLDMKHIEMELLCCLTVTEPFLLIKRYNLITEAKAPNNRQYVAIHYLDEVLELL
jgi:hypothetical protein